MFTHFKLQITIGKEFGFTTAMTTHVSDDQYRVLQGGLISTVHEVQQQIYRIWNKPYTSSRSK